MQTLTGPVTTITRVTQKNIAETNLLMNAKIISNAVPLGPNMGDVDSDNTKEAAPFVPAVSGETAPAHGGFLPVDLGLTLTDPWGTKYGYCVWDHGSVTNTANYIPGDDGNADEVSIQPMIALISAGPDKIFQTACPTFSSAATTPMNTQKAAGSDDLVQEFTYSGASAAANGLWTLTAPGSDTAQLRSSDNTTANVSVNRDTGMGDFLGLTTNTLAAKTDNVELAGGLKLDVLGSEICDAGSEGTMRFDTSEKMIVVCNGSAGEWVPAGSKLWETDGTHVWREAGNVGIGTDSPSSALDVVGAAEISTDLTVGGAAVIEGNATIGTDALTVIAGSNFVGIGKAVPTTALDVVGDTLLTGNAALTGDLAVATDVFTVDASTGRIGSGTASPEHQLDIIGNSTIGTVGLLDESNAIVRIQEASSGPNLYLDGNTLITDATMLIGSIGNAGMQFLANSSVAMAIDALGVVNTANTLNVGGALNVTGNTLLSGTLQVTENAAFDTDTLFVDVTSDAVGIGTSSPQARLDVDGGIRVGQHSTGSACTPDGVIQFNGSQLQICIGGAWSGVSSIEKLDDIGDVFVPSPNHGEVLAWDDSANSGAGGWVNKHIIDLGPGNATAHGSDGDVQFNGGDELDSHPQFFFNKTDVRLGIGTSSPGTTLHVDGTATVSGDVIFGEDFQVDTDTLVVNATLNSVGIGVAAPKARLDVGGGIKLGNDTNCAADKDGTLRFTGTALEMCMSEVWSPIQGSGGPGGPGSTMVTGWPDAINCGPVNQPSIYYLVQAPAASGKFEYRNIWHNAERVVRFNADKTYFDKDTPGTDTGCTSQSINVLYAQQRAYNFVGGDGGEDSVSFVPTAPDALDCGDHSVNGTVRMLYLQTATTTRWTYAMSAGASGIGMQISFSPSDGTWIETINNAGWTDAGACDTLTIAALAADDRTFNLAGGGGGGGSGGSGAVGSDGYIQFATAGVLDGEAGLHYNKTIDRVSVAGGVKIGNDTTCAVGGADNGTMRFDATKVQFCYNGAWVDMAASGTPVETDPQVGTVINGAWCVGGAGNTLNCTAAEPVLTEVDPKITSSLTSGYLCNTNGTTISCNVDPASVGGIANGSVTYAKIQDVTGSRLLGRYATSAGVAQEISIGAGLSLNSSTGELTATVTAGVAGNDTEVQFNDNGALAGDPDMTWNKTTNRLTIVATATTGFIRSGQLELTPIAGNAPQTGGGGGGGGGFASMTRTARDALSATEGMMIYNTTDHRPEYYDGAEWRTFGGTSVTAFASNSSLGADLRAWYKLDSSAAPAIDSKGTHNWTSAGGTINWSQAGVHGTSACFTGASNSNLGSGTVSYSKTDAYSVSLWFKGTAATAGLMGDDGTAYIGLSLVSGRPVYHYYNGAWLSHSATTAINNNAWHHIVYVHRGDQTLDIYVDGVKEVNNVSAPTTTANPHDFLYLAYGYGSNYAVGCFDEIGIWNRALNAGDVSTLYAGGSGVTYQP